VPSFLVDPRTNSSASASEYRDVATKRAVIKIAINFMLLLSFSDPLST
jgi:hypothetical protein